MTGQQRSPSKFTPGASPLSAGHGSPAAMTVCQKSAARETTTMRRIRPRVSRSKALSWEVSRSGSLMRNYSVARQRANLTDIDKDFLNRPLSADAGRRIAARRHARRALHIGKARRRLLSGRNSRRDKSGEAHRALAGASLDRGAAGATSTNASREGFTPRQPALTGNGGE